MVSYKTIYTLVCDIKIFFLTFVVEKEASLASGLGQRRAMPVIWV
jgi:hypothetical protein